MSRLVGLYPRAWRDRYGDELLALLEARPPGTRDRLDLARGALDARLHPELTAANAPTPADGRATAAHRIGQVALSGAAAWLVGIVVAINGPLVHDEWGTYRDGSAGHVWIILAIGLLVVGIAATAARLPAGDRVGRASAWIAGGAGLWWALAPWIAISALTFSAAFVGLAVAAVRNGLWSRIALVVIVVGLAVPWLGAAGLIASGLDGWAAALSVLSVVWIVVALPLLDARPVRPVPGGPSGTPASG